MDSYEGATQIDGLHGSSETITVTKSEPVMVRPATKTNDGIYFLSNLDQNLAFIVEMLYSFNATEKKIADNITEVLKKSLAEALVHYYPLAGKLVADSDKKLMVKCTGDGVLFVEAVADSEIEALGDIIMCKDDTTQAKLVHTFPQQHDILQVPLLTIQVTKFKCGGFILGVAINHCVADTLSTTQFMNSWAEIARGVGLTVPPFLDRSSLKSREPPAVKYPHHELSVIKQESSDDSYQEEHKWQVGSFCFEPPKLAKLKKAVEEDGLVKNSSSFTTLAALFWRARTKALNMEPHKQARLLFPVDVRSRFNPPLPEGFFGNGIGLVCCSCTAGELIEKPLSFAVKQVQEAISSATEDYIRSVIDYYEVTRAITHLPITTLLVSTWTRLPWNACDFGWGKAAQLGCATIPEPLALFLPCGNERNGVKLLMGLPEPSMKIFQDLMLQI